MNDKNKVPGFAGCTVSVRVPPNATPSVLRAAYDALAADMPGLLPVLKDDVKVVAPRVVEATVPAGSALSREALARMAGEAES